MTLDRRKKLIFFFVMFSSIPLISPPLGWGGCVETCTTYQQNKENSVKDTSINWALVGPHCEAYQLIKLSQPLDITSTTLYSAAATTCWVACFASATPIGPAANTACTVVGGVNIAFDLASNITITVKGQKVFDWWSSQMGTQWGGLAAGVVGEAATAASGTLFKGASSAQAASCAAAALFTVGAAVKGSNIHTLKKLKETECTQIDTLSSTQTNPLASSTRSQAVAPSLNGAPGLTHSVSGKTTGIAQTSSSSEVPLSMDSSHFPQGSFAEAASAPPLSSLVQQMPNLSQIPTVLAPLGLSLEDLTRKLQNPQNSGAGAGSTIQEALSALDNMPPELGSTLSQLDTLARTGQIQMGGLSQDPLSSSYSGPSGERSTTREPKSLSPGGTFSFGSKTGTHLSPKEMTFLPTTPHHSASSLSESTDIWHSQWKGTLFELMTETLKKNLNRVQQEEWDLPMNRALKGLPRKK